MAEYEPPKRRKSFGGAIVLIVLGAVLLLFTLQRDLSPWPILSRYWPLILIFLGLGKLWDYLQRRNDPESAPRGGVSGAAVAMLLLVVIFGLLLWHGHSGTANPFYQETRSIERQGARSLQASVNMPAGELRVSGGSGDLLEANFNYSESEGRPQVDYTVTDGAGHLSIQQQNQGINVGRTHNEWDLRFAKDLPTDLSLNMGAGQGILHMGDVNLTRLSVNMGAGQLDLDLLGDRKADLKGEIHGGVGQVKIRLPRNVGVRVHASGGIGAIDAPNLRREGDTFVNAAYGKSPVTIEMTVEGGIGQITLDQQP